MEGRAVIAVIAIGVGKTSLPVQPSMKDFPSAAEWYAWVLTVDVSPEGGLCWLQLRCKKGGVIAECLSDGSVDTQQIQAHFILHVDSLCLLLFPYLVTPTISGRP